MKLQDLQEAEGPRMHMYTVRGNVPIGKLTAAGAQPGPSTRPTGINRNVPGIKTQSYTVGGISIEVEYDQHKIRYVTFYTQPGEEDRAQQLETTISNLFKQIGGRIRRA
ncbi:hypothetical protein D3C75_343310 [compost metagenome]